MNFMITLTEFIESLKDQNHDPGDLIEKLWETKLPVKEKIFLSLDIYDLYPSYSVLSNMWLEYKCSDEIKREFNDIIFKKYQDELSTSDKRLSESTEYSLYFDVFEDPDRNKDAWNYFLNNNPTNKFLKIMLANSGPVPYDLKHQLYEKLIKDENFHLDIYKSIRHSCFDNCGIINKEQAKYIFTKLKLADKMDEVNKYGYYQKYENVVNYLNI
jgi:hypothetical protein